MSTFLLNPARAAILECANVTGIPHSRLYSTRKTVRIVRARWACFIVLRRLGLSFHEIADEFGMDHSNIIYGCNKGTALMQSNAWFQALVDHLNKHLS